MLLLWIEINDLFTQYIDHNCTMFCNYLNDTLFHVDFHK